MKKKNHIIVGLGVFFSIYAVILLGKIVAHEFESIYFVSAKGTILSAQIGSKTAVFDVPMSGATFSRVYYPKINFEYEVNGMKITGDRYSIAIRRYGSKTRVEHILSKYPVGSTVIVWFNPKQPTFAIIEKKISLVPLFLTSIAIIYLMTIMLWWPVKVILKKIKCGGDNS